MPKKIKNNKKRSVQIRNKNKNSIHININSNNKRRGTSSGGQRQQSSHPTIIMSAPHVPYIPTDSGTSNLYPILSDIKERLTIQAKQPQQVKEFVGVNEPVAEVKPERNTPSIVKVAPEDKSISKYYDTNSIASINDIHSPIYPMKPAKPPALPSPYTPAKELDGRPRIPNPSGKGASILVGGAAYLKYVKQGLIKDIR